MSEVNKSNIVNYDAKITATLSVKTDTNLIYDQQFYLDVTLSADFNFPAGKTLNVMATGSGMTITPTKVPPTTFGAEKNISALYWIAIDSFEAGTITNSQVNFTVTLGNNGNNIYNQKFSYNVKKILSDTLRLQPNKLVCVIPEKYTVPQPNDPQEKYILYETQILEDTGNPKSKTPLKNAIVYIISSPIGDLKSEFIFTSDSSQEATQLTIYKPIKFGYSDAIKLISDDDTGKIKFRVYSKNSNPYMLKLFSLTSLDDAVEEGESVFFIAPRTPTDLDVFEPLYIPEANEGVISSNPDKPTFEVVIQNDYDYRESDNLLFFTKETNNIPDVNSLILPIYKMTGGFDVYNYPIPFKNFKINKWTEIFYVITGRGYTYYSMIEKIKYIGDSFDPNPHYSLNFELIKNNAITNDQVNIIKAILTGTGDGVNIANCKLNLSVDGSASFKEDSKVQSISVTTDKSGTVNFALYDTNKDGETVTLTGFLDSDKTVTATKQIYFQRNDLFSPLLPQSRNGIINKWEVNQEQLVIIVNHYNSIHTGDQIIVYLNGKDKQLSSIPYIITDENIHDREYEITMLFSDIPLGSYDVFYTITNMDNKTEKSASTCVIINDSDSSLL
jgi:hypothetical protein